MEIDPEVVLNMNDANKLLRSLIHPLKERDLNSDSIKNGESLLVKNFAHHLELLELKTEDFSVIHVAGTKGKGSVCCFVENILRNCGIKTGLYTSPHLVEVNERIRINGRSISDGILARHIFNVYEKLNSALSKEGDISLMRDIAEEDEKEQKHVSWSSNSRNSNFPGYFKFLTLVGLSIFKEEKVDVVILETGMGGRHDATNVFPKPVVCGITLIDYDHMEFLGNTLGEIAREKGMIIKKNVPCFTVEQLPEALAVLLECGREKNIDVIIAPKLGIKHKLGINGEFQYCNAALALCLAHKWLVENQNKLKNLKIPNYLNLDDIPSPFSKGMEISFWPGRCQIVDLNKKVKFFLDGAHTKRSIEYCLKWFNSETTHIEENLAKLSQDSMLESSSTQNFKSIRRILVFSCTTNRNPFELLKPLAFCKLFSTFLICPLSDSKPGAKPQSIQQIATKKNEIIPPEFFLVNESKNITFDSSINDDDGLWMNTVLQVWYVLNEYAPFKSPKVSENRSLAFPSAKHIMDGLQSNLFGPDDGVIYHVFVTGSLYLVGDFLRELRNRVENLDLNKTNFS